MLTKILPTELPKPVSARAAARVHPLPDLGSGSPSGDGIYRGAVGTRAPVILPQVGGDAA